MWEITMMHHGAAEFGGLNYFCNFNHDPTQIAGRFGRMFPTLPGLYTEPDVLTDLGAVNGPMDGGTSPDRSSTIDVGLVFFGQFVDHDITLDTSSSLSAVNAPGAIVNLRTPTLDLDCIYGDGPEGSPFLYRDGVYLLTGADGTAITQDPALRDEDLSRASNGRAIIGDPRNDENRVISQIQLAMHRFHNETAKHLANTHPGLEGHELFEEARHIVTAHYHWSLLYDFLPHICGSEIVSDIFHNGRRVYCVGSNQPFIPVEFSVSGFRFGHTLVPQEVQAQTSKPARAIFGDIFGKGFSPLENPEAVVDMHEIFTTSEGRIVQKSEKMDSKFARTLLKLPGQIASNPSSLATRNLLRGQSFMLPSGESVSRAMGIDDAVIASISDAANMAAGGGLNGCTPLFYYMLMEAETIGRKDQGEASKPGEGLGPMGGRLVAETIIGLMELDPRSFLSTNRQWSPALGLGDSVRTVGDMLTFRA